MLLAAGADSNKATAIPEGVTPVFIAAKEGHLHIVRALVDAGADKNQAIRAGATPLLVAVQKGHLNIVRSLLEAGAAIDQAMEGVKHPC